MIVTPAILTTEVEELRDLLIKYSDAGFEYIDIDIQEQPFATNSTVSAMNVITTLIALDEKLEGISVGVDLKLGHPEEAVKRLQSYVQRIYVYQHADIDFTSELNCQQLGIGVGVYADQPLLDAEFYNHFPEVQFMSIANEKQGSSIEPELLSRADKLHSLGYNGKISVDGGVNPDTAAEVVKHPIDRVSVGSYFQKADDLQANQAALRAALESSLA